MATLWQDSISYNEFVTAVKNAYAGKSSITWSEVSNTLAQAGCNTDNYLEYLESFPNAVDVCRNANGSVRAVRVNPYASIYSQNSWSQASAAGSYNSNLIPATGKSEALVSIPANAVTQPGSTSLTFTQGLKQAGNFVLKEVAPAVMAAGLGIKLGKAIDGAIYNIGTAMGLNPPWELDPTTWDSITAGSRDPASRLFNTVFGIDSNGRTQMYADADTIALLSYWMAQQGFFSTGGPHLDPDKLPSKAILDYPNYDYSVISLSPSIHAVRLDDPSMQMNINAPGFFPLNSAGMAMPVACSQSPFSAEGEWPYTAYPVEKYSFRYYIIPEYIAFRLDAYMLSPSPTALSSSLFSYWDIAYLYFNGATSGGGVAPEGVTNQENALIPSTVGWNSPQEALQSLQQQYPDWFANPVSYDVVQPDGSIITYYYYPVGFPEPDGSTGTQTQDDTDVDPDDSTQTLIDYITDILTQPKPQTDPQSQTDPNTQPDSSSPTLPPNPTDTGDGNTPTIPPVTGSASSLWKIYNPSQGELDAFGAWLWSSDFIDQIKKLFNDPMQAIIGVHKVFCTPAIGGVATIKCGYLDSEVPSNWVSNQYTHIDCGTISLPEYFGNVFDYDPYTRVSIFIPCVGIVPLDVADVMRSSINVKLHCDVLTGAMLAEVYVYRDGAGGNLYTYSGSCIVTYPVSSGTYIGAVANVVATAASVAAGIMGTVTTGGALAPVAVGAAGAAVSGLSHTHTNVQHSGSFSGAAGVMGGKIPYLIVLRPQTRLADNYPAYDGVPANYTSQLGACSGYVKVKEVHLKVPNAFESELTEIEQLLHQGILI